MTYGRNAIRFYSLDFATKFSAAVRALNAIGIIPQVNSAYRDNAGQQRMRDGGSGGNPAASGVSLHQTGNAVDINGTWTKDFQTIKKIMTDLGFTWGGTFLKTDPPHFELNPYGFKGTVNYDLKKASAAREADDYYRTRTESCWVQ